MPNYVLFIRYDTYGTHQEEFKSLLLRQYAALTAQDKPQSSSILRLDFLWLNTEWVGIGMEGCFEIFGTLIPLKTIKGFRLVQREYIYRPTYSEGEKNLLGHRKVTFFGMQPYAAIIDENEKGSALKEYKTKTFRESIAKDFIEGVVTTIGDKWNIKAIKAKKYTCINQSGRLFKTYLDDVPALLMRYDGRAIDVQKNDEIYPILGESIAPAINVVFALQIIADTEYTFYGNDVQIHDIGAEYERLKIEYEAYQGKKTIESGKGTKLSLPKFSKIKLLMEKEPDTEAKPIEETLSEIKTKYNNGEISEDEYHNRINEAMKKL